MLDNAKGGVASWSTFEPLTRIVYTETGHNEASRKKSREVF